MDSKLTRVSTVNKNAYDCTSLSAIDERYSIGQVADSAPSFFARDGAFCMPFVH